MKAKLAAVKARAVPQIEAKSQDSDNVEKAEAEGSASPKRLDSSMYWIAQTKPPP
jgi:hypothetical protein